MALIRCRGCGGQISTNTTACQRCGAQPKSAQWSLSKVMLWTLIAGFVMTVPLIIISRYMDGADRDREAEDTAAAERGLRSAMTAEQYADYTASNKEKADLVAAAKKLTQAKIDAQLLALSAAESDVKSILKDSGSARFGTKNFYKNPSAAIGITICGYVNAKNSFGAYTGNKGYMVIDRYATIEGVDEDFLDRWNRLCR
jgi:hypothetical protein